MKTEIKKVNDFFVQKILNKEYEIKELNDYTANIIVDNFKFCIWMGNGPQNTRCYLTSQFDNFMMLDFKREQQEKIYKYFNAIRKENEVEMLLAERREIEQKLLNLK
jgi:hypothetical protein